MEFGFYELLVTTGRGQSLGRDKSLDPVGRERGRVASPQGSLSPEKFYLYTFCSFWYGWESRSDLIVVGPVDAFGRGVDNLSLLK